MTVEVVDQVLSFSREDYCLCIKVVLQSDAELAAPGAGAGGRGEVWLQPPSRPHGLRSLAQGSNNVYYVAGRLGSWDNDHETIGLTHPFYHDLRWILGSFRVSSNFT